ncbi:MAG: ATP-dependent helicase HrpB [Desulfobulbaceae bacterium]|nr:ATP-dependent helicase HrpB [Desulfobulbaceae bacterium]
MAELPINAILPELTKALARNNRLILSAPPGSGKTTGVPPALLGEPWLKDKKILILEPRRLAARSAAGRMADLRNEQVGDTVGYRVRFDNKVSERTRIEVVTEGILTRMLQSDPELAGVGVVIFDEFHERSLHADLGLALALDAQEGLRDDLRLLVMSATLDLDRLRALLPTAELLVGEGRSFPVEIRHLDRDPDPDLVRLAASGIRTALAEQRGDILAFLPGAGEIRKVAATLAGLAKEQGILLHSLYGDMPLAAQSAAILPDTAGRRRVVLATSIAETSLTIDGITTVVDCGWARRPRFNGNSGLSRLETVRISSAAADQRAGRAGRVGPGVCYRLWSKHTQQGLVPHLEPEIRETDLTSLALQLAHWGVNDPSALRWLDPPPPTSLAHGRAILQELEALDPQGRITSLGKEMARLPLHPRLAHMLLVGARAGGPRPACQLAALLAERDPLRNSSGPRETDLDKRLRLLRVFQEEGPAAARALGGDPDLCRRILQAAEQWLRLLPKGNAKKAPPLSAGGLLSLAYPDRIGQQRAANSHAFLLANGRGARLPNHDSLCSQPYLVAAELDAGTIEGRIFLAAPISLDEIETLHRRRIHATRSIQWDSRPQAVAARSSRRLGSLVLDSAPLKNPDPEEIRQAMLDGIRQLGIIALPWDTAARELQARLIALGHWHPDEGWPAVDDGSLLATLAHWLGPYLDRISRRDQLKQLDLATILKGMLDWPRLQRLDQGAPTHLQVPSGSRVRLQYNNGEPPVLAVRLQELFGLADTPTVCWGEVQVVLHLLSPARRPIQVTRDLRGFWDRTYPEVKKELQGRYPKHHWPDDPWSATATARAKPRGR